jgi:hypothetical protein
MVSARIDARDTRTAQSSRSDGRASTGKMTQPSIQPSSRMASSAIAHTAPISVSLALPSRR